MVFMKTILALSFAALTLAAPTPQGSDLSTGVDLGVKVVSTFC
jgi:hypothetical protein